MLPQLHNQTFLTDGGLETTLVFLEGVELRDFAAFELLTTATGRARLESYYHRHADIARSHGTGFIFEAPTWRASADWGKRLGYDHAALRRLNMQAIEMLRRLRDDYAEAAGMPGVVSGCIGPRSDGYASKLKMTADAAQEYHHAQIDAFAEAGADMAFAMTLNYPDEATGIVRAAQAAGLSIAISFTVETDGLLPSGHDLPAAIEHVDDLTGGSAAYFAVNCAHPNHFRHIFKNGGGWRQRIRGIRANASQLSHAELDEAETLDAGDPEELGSDYRKLREFLTGLTVLGGCCGTDHRHIAAIARKCT